jgi:hypothetical protein
MRAAARNSGSRTLVEVLLLQWLHNPRRACHTDDERDHFHSRFHECELFDSISDQAEVILYSATFVVHPRFMGLDLSLIL